MKYPDFGVTHISPCLSVWYMEWLTCFKKEEEEKNPPRRSSLVTRWKQMCYLNFEHSLSSWEVGEKMWPSEEEKCSTLVSK